MNLRGQGAGVDTGPPSHGNTALALSLARRLAAVRAALELHRRGAVTAAACCSSTSIASTNSIYDPSLFAIGVGGLRATRLGRPRPAAGRGARPRGRRGRPGSSPTRRTNSSSGRSVAGRAAHRAGGRAAGAAAHDADAVVLSPPDHRVRPAAGAGERAEAVGVFDEVMLAVSSDETSPAVVGLCYCVSVAACMLLRDVVRARAWTATLDRWCAARPDLVAYRGTCLVHRAQMSTLGGDWAALSPRRPTPSSCSRGRPRARPPTSSASCTGSWAPTSRRRTRTGGPTRWVSSPSRALPAAHRPGAPRGGGPRRCAGCAPSRDRPRTGPSCWPRGWTPSWPGRRRGRAGSAEELRGPHRGTGSPLLRGLADQAEGAVLLAADRPGRRPRRPAAGAAALERTRPPARLRAGARPGRPVPAGDWATRSRPTWSSRPPASASSAWAPRRTSPASTTPRRRPDRPGPGGLTDREIEVVRLVAAGHTNRAIAGRLCLSEKTVARHLANIYAKLDVPSRAAATAYAYDHGLV